MMDTQVVELLGRHRLIDDLLRAGLEVAAPIRDRGIDLIAYADLDDQVDSFIARPIQMKAASRGVFGVWKKYAKIRDMIFAYVWNLDGSAPCETYALTYSEALVVAEALGWTETRSWRQKGGYVTNKPGKRLRDVLAGYRMTPERWWSTVTTVAAVPDLPPERVIANEDLRLDDVPPVDSDWDTIGEFAQTFNGYGYWGSFERCAEVALARPSKTLTELRTCLFFAQRSWHHTGDYPVGEAADYARSLLEGIRANLRAG